MNPDVLCIVDILSSQVATRSSKSSKVLGSVALTREKVEAGDPSEGLGVITRARKRRMVETSGARNIQKEVIRRS